MRELILNSIMLRSLTLRKHTHAIPDVIVNAMNNLLSPMHVSTTNQQYAHFIHYLKQLDCD